MRIVLPVGRYCLRFLPHSTPVPVAKIRLLRKLCFGRDALFPETESLQLTGKDLQNAALRRALEKDEMGTWSMSPATLNFLEDEIHAQQPTVVLELGSGLSTICLAQYMHETHGPSGGTYVCSLEQDLGVIERTVPRLRAMGLEKHVQIFHAPLSWQVIEGVKTSCYSLPRSFMETIATLRPGFVVIDGPATETDRFGTLPLIRPYLNPNARFYLDDALRDGELDVAENWARLPYVQVNGIYLTEKGLLLGNLQSSAE
jgi:hypothetical protein